MLKEIFLAFLPDIYKNIRSAIPQAIKKWRLKKFFGVEVISGNNFYIVVDPYQHPLPRRGNRYIKKFYGRRNDQPLIGEDDVMGINTVRVINHVVSLFSKYRDNQPLPIVLDKEVRDLWDGSFLCFGSSDSNIKTFDVENLPQNTFYKFVFNKQGHRSFKVRGEIFSIKGREDVGIILKLKNPHHQEHSLFICAGLGEWGTSGSAYYLLHNWESILKETRNRNFCKVIRVKVQSDESAREVAHFQDN